MQDSLKESNGKFLVSFAIKSKGGDCWHYDACVVLDGNPLIEEHLTYILSAESTEEISDVTYYIDAGQFKLIMAISCYKSCLSYVFLFNLDLVIP